MDKIKNDIGNIDWETEKKIKMLIKPLKYSIIN